MPLYDCECEKCGYVHEMNVPLERLDDFDAGNVSDELKCPNCGGKMVRWIAAPMVRFG
jgi:predicted nucleic acid-binding Zn ribbon protein